MVIDRENIRDKRALPLPKFSGAVFSFKHSLPIH
jgi:hypothetical protein